MDDIEKDSELVIEYKQSSHLTLPLSQLLKMVETDYINDRQGRSTYEPEVVEALIYKIQDLQKDIYYLKRYKYNKYLNELCKGKTPVKITSSEQDAIEALDIINTTKCYKNLNFNDSIYNNGTDSYVIIW